MKFMQRTMMAVMALFVTVAAVMTGCTSAPQQAADAGTTGSVVSSPVDELGRPIPPATSNDDVFAGKEALNIEGVGNFRDLGGYRTTEGKTVKTGLIYRAGELQHITEAGKAEFAKLNMSVVFDLRSARDHSANPDPEFEGAEEVSVPMPSGTPAGLPEYSSEEEFYRDIAPWIIKDMSDFLFVASSTRAHFRTIIQKANALGGKSAFLFHCSHGKDRTGFVAAVLLKVLGVDNDTVLKDYLASNIYRLDAIQKEADERRERDLHGDPELMKNFYRFHFVQPENASYIKDIDRLYGSADTYLINEAGLTQEELDTFRSLYLE
jgi:protein-tyrosine phosphatase